MTHQSVLRCGTYWDCYVCECWSTNNTSMCTYYVLRLSNKLASIKTQPPQHQLHFVSWLFWQLKEPMSTSQGGWGGHSSLILLSLELVLTWKVTLVLTGHIWAHLEMDPTARKLHICQDIRKITFIIMWDVFLCSCSNVPFQLDSDPSDQRQTVWNQFLLCNNHSEHQQPCSISPLLGKYDWIETFSKRHGLEIRYKSNKRFR